MNKEDIYKRLKIFGEKNKDVFAIIIFGSTQSKDIFSDVDLFIFTDDPQKYLSKSTDWLQEIGNPICKLDTINPIEKNFISRIMFDDYMSLDVIPIKYSDFKKANIFFFLKKWGFEKFIPKKLKNSTEENFRTFYHYIRNSFVLYDRKNITHTINEILNLFDENKHQKYLYEVDEKKFTENHEDFWLMTFKTIGTFVRNDICYGTVFCENIMKKRLIQIIEWYTFSFENNNKTDLKYLGKDIIKWANSDILLKLSRTFDYSDQKRSLASIQSSVSLYKELSEIIADKYNFKKNIELEKMVYDSLNAYLQKDI